MTMTDETMRAIPAMLRAAQVMKLNSDRLRASTDSRDPYVARAIAAQGDDARILAKFAQTICLHPDTHYLQAEDLAHRSRCDLCEKVWGSGESRAVAA